MNTRVLQIALLFTAVNLLEHAGATLPRRDAVDARVVQEVRDDTGRIIKWVRDVGWPDFGSAAAH